MADSVQHRWYPTPNSPREDTDRIIFDNLYELQDSMSKSASSAKAGASGQSLTVFFPGGFQVGSTTYYRMTFQNGSLVAVS